MTVAIAMKADATLAALDPSQQAIARRVRSELLAADEAFFCGTAWEVTPIATIDRLPVGEAGVGPVTRKLQAAYFDIVRGRTPEFAEWRTAVY